MDEVYRIADRITILRNGANLITSLLSEITPREIVAGIVGSEVADEQSGAPEPANWARFCLMSATCTPTA